MLGHSYIWAWVKNLGQIGSTVIYTCSSDVKFFGRFCKIISFGGGLKLANFILTEKSKFSLIKKSAISNLVIS